MNNEITPSIHRYKWLSSKQDQNSFVSSRVQVQVYSHCTFKLIFQFASTVTTFQIQETRFFLKRKFPVAIINYSYFNFYPFNNRLNCRRENRETINRTVLRYRGCTHFWRGYIRNPSKSNKWHTILETRVQLQVSATSKSKKHNQSKTPNLKCTK